jgi:hypothetical protein
MLTEQELNEHKALIDKANELSKVKSSIIADMKAKQEQGVYILGNYGYKKFSDIPKLVEELNNLEGKIMEEKAEAEKEIIEINKLKEEVDNIIAGS